MTKKINSQILVLVAITAIAFLFRVKLVNSPFWVDEYSTASQSKSIMKLVGIGDGATSFVLEKNNLLTHIIVAVSFSLFGTGTFQARLPMMIIGSLVPALIYLLTKKHVSQPAAVSASLLYVFSYIQITWAQQARGYVLQQLLLLVLLYLYADLVEKFTKPRMLLFGVLLVLGFLTHTTFILVLIAILLHACIYHRSKIVEFIQKPIGVLSSLGLIAVIGLSGQLQMIFSQLQRLLESHPNNLAYYHSFLWREQTVVALLAFLGILILFLFQKKHKVGLLLLLPVLLYLFFVCFMFFPYVSRYLLPIFPILYIFVGIAVSHFAVSVNKKYVVLVTLLVTSFIVINGDKFVLKPKEFYSVNHDMREIALVDYDQIYNLIQSKAKLEENTAVIDTWPDRMKWYLGENTEYFFIFRWINTPGLENGIAKRTDYVTNELGVRQLVNSGNPPIKFIGDLNDLLLAMDKYPQGFILIDDSSLPADVIEYAEANFTKELYLDHYPLDDNPYSIWPTTLYSWGFTEE